VKEPFDVFVNGVPQRRGVDFEVEPGLIVFAKELRSEGRLGFWRWTSLFLGVAGTYRRNDKVDVVYPGPSGRTVVTLEPVPVLRSPA
jgi:hypothetical protein